MKIDTDKLTEVTLALMYLGLFQDGEYDRAWKGFDREVLGKLYEKNFIADPNTKSKSVFVTKEGRAMMEKLFETYFCI